MKAVDALARAREVLRSMNSRRLSSGLSGNPAQTGGLQPQPSLQRGSFSSSPQATSGRVSASFPQTAGLIVGTAPHAGARSAGCTLATLQGLCCKRSVSAFLP